MPGFAAPIGSYFGGDVDTRRSVFVSGSLFGVATGATKVRGYSVGGTIGHRFLMQGGYKLIPQVSAGATGIKRDAFAETGAGVLSLTSAKETRDLYQATGELRLSHRSDSAGRWFEPFAGGGIRHNWGDRDATAAMGFNGAPVGVGAFTIQGTELPKWAGIVSGGFDARVSDRVAVGLSSETTISRRQREGRLNLHIKVGF